MKRIWLTILALAAGAVGAGHAVAQQYHGYGYSYDAAPDYYYGRGPYVPPGWGYGGDPDDYPPPPRRAPRQSYDYDRAPPPPDRDADDDRGPDRPRNAERLPYADPLYGQPRDQGYGYGPQAYSPNGGDGYDQPYGGDPNHKASDADLGENANRTTRTEVANTTNQPPGVIIINTAERHLYYTQPNGQALQYGIGVGRQGFTWKGTARVERKSEWPDWIPPSDMLKRRPDLPTRMAGGIENPLGARAMYLFQGNKDTMFRIHGTNEPDTIGKAVSSGCIRMMNADVIDLYSRVPVGTKVVVL